MDFLDPRKRRVRQRRLIIGYCLLTLVIAATTVILVYAAYGYGINTQTGQIVENSLLFTDSKPSKADIYLDGVSQNASTPARLVLPAGNHTLTFKKAGYRPWQRTVDLHAHNLYRYTYPMLLPIKPVAKTLFNLGSSVPFISQSPDHRWVLIQTAGSIPKSLVLEEFDTANLTQAPTKLTLPSNLLTNLNKPGSRLLEVEWAADNNRLLLKHTYSGGSEFVIIDRKNPSNSLNINQLFKVNPTQVSWRDKKTDALYIFDQSKGSLAVADLASRQLGSPIIEQTLAYKAFGANTVVYVSKTSNPNKLMARIWDSGKIYALSPISAGGKYFVEAVQFQGRSYFTLGSSSQSNLSIYIDPSKQLRAKPDNFILPALSLKIPLSSEISFSPNNRFITAGSGQHEIVYDFLNQSSYQFTVAKTTSPLHWVDDFRLVGRSGSQIMLTDYDGTNQQLFASTAWDSGALFDKNLSSILTLNLSSKTHNFSFESIAL